MSENNDNSLNGSYVQPPVSDNPRVQPLPPSDGAVPLDSLLSSAASPSAGVPSSDTPSSDTPSAVSPSPETSAGNETSMFRLTLRALLAYIDNLLPARDAAAIEQRLAQNDNAGTLCKRIRSVLEKPVDDPFDVISDDLLEDPNVAAEYLDNVLSASAAQPFEKNCLVSDSHLTEVACCHQILTVVLASPADVDTAWRQRAYDLAETLDSRPETDSPAVVTPEAHFQSLENYAQMLAAQSEVQAAGSAAEEPGGNTTRNSLWLAGLLAVVFVILTALFFMRGSDKTDSVAENTPADTQTLAEDDSVTAGNDTTTNETNNKTTNDETTNGSTDKTGTAGETGVTGGTADSESNPNQAAADESSNDETDTVDGASTSSKPSGPSVEPVSVPLLEPSEVDSTAAEKPVPTTTTPDSSTPSRPTTPSRPGLVNPAAQPDGALRETSSASSIPGSQTAPNPDSAIDTSAPAQVTITGTNPPKSAKPSEENADDETDGSANSPVDTAADETKADENAADDSDKTASDSGEEVVAIAPPPTRIGKYYSTNEVLLLQETPEEGQKTWLRIPAEEGIKSGATLLALPEFLPSILFDDSVRVILLGPAMVKIDPRTTDKNLLLNLEYGRMIIVADQNLSQNVYVTTTGTNARVVVNSPQSVIAVEVQPTLKPDSDPSKNNPQLAFSVMAINGKANFISGQLVRGKGKPVALETKSMADVITGRVQKDVTEFPQWTNAQTKRSAIVESFGNQLRMQSSKPPLMLLHEIADSTRPQNIFARQALVLMGDITPLIEDLTSQDKKVFWARDVMMLQEAVARSMESALSISKQLNIRFGDKGDLLFDLLWKYESALSGDEAADVIEYLNDEDLPVRVVTLSILKDRINTGAYKPEAPNVSLINRIKTNAKNGIGTESR